MNGQSRVAAYVVREALLPMEGGGFLQRWYVYRDFLPIEAINLYLNRKSAKSPRTGRTYAYLLAAWLNFLDMRKTEYFNATREDVEAFKDYIAYGLHGDNVVLKINADITFRTLVVAITAIQGFYRWFEGHVEVFVPQLSTKNNAVFRIRAKHSFKYGLIYEKSAEEFVDLEHMRLKPSGYKKHWLTEAEKAAILDKFNTVRDKAIFMLLCEGMRIDEVVSIKYSAYNSGEFTLTPSRSKGHSDGNDYKLRLIAFHDSRTGQFLDQYIATERSDVETNLDDYLELMFVNLKKYDGSYGKAVTYRNWWGVLKTAVAKAGIDPSEVATHVGRRSYVQTLLEGGQDTEHIRQLVGWASLSALDNYRNLRSKVIIKNAAEKARRQSRECVETI